MDIIKPIIITATIPVIVFIGGIGLFFIGIDYLYESYHAYFFNNSNDRCLKMGHGFLMDV